VETLLKVGVRSDQFVLQLPGPETIKLVPGFATVPCLLVALLKFVNPGTFYFASHKKPAFRE
jgi:hypothetical protein